MAHLSPHADQTPGIATIATAEDLRPWHLGVSGYRYVQELLAAEISPAEAAAAEKLFHHSRRHFAAWIASLLLLHFSRLWLLNKGTWLWATSYDLLTAVLILSYAYFAVRWRMPIAGKILLPLHAAFWSFDQPHYNFDLLRESWSTELQFVAPLLAALGIGWLLDSGAPRAADPLDCTESRSRRILMSLGGCAVLLVAASYTYAGSGLRPPSLLTMLTAGALAIWPWTPWMPFAAKWSSQPWDVRRLADAAQLRWGRVLAGRLLAILLAILPLLLFLSALGLNERMRWPATGDAVVTKRIKDLSSGEREEVVWFWNLTGEFLRPSDFQRFVIYRRDSSPSRDNRLHPADPVHSQAVAGPEAEQLYREWVATVDKQRLHSADEFARFAERNSSPSLRFLQKLDASPSYAFPAGTTLVQARNMELEPYSRDKTLLIGKIVDRNIAPFVVFTALGFLALWRRGGDSATAWWLGVWLLASTGACNAGLLQFSFESLREELLQRSLAGNNLADWTLLNLSSLWMLYVNSFILYLFGIPMAGIWVHLCWPTRPTPRLWHAWLLNAGKIAVVTAAIRFAHLISAVVVFCYVYFSAAAFERAGKLSEADTPTMGLVSTAATLVFICLLVVGWCARRRTSRFSESPYLTWRPVAAIVLAHLSLVLFFPGGVLALYSESEWTWQAGAGSLIGWWLGMACLVGFVVMASWALLRDNFLRLAAVRDYSTLIVMFLLPITFESLEQFAGNLLAMLGSVLHSAQGISVVSLLMTIAVLGPLWSLLQRLFVVLSAPQIRLFERSTVEALEQMVVAPPGDDQLAAVKDFFERTHVDQYAIYARQGANTFSRLHQRLDWQSTERLNVSAHLRDFLSGQPKFIDLYDAPFEWTYFFQQFELHRLQLATHCRYVMPICLGSSLRGLLLLPDDDRAVRITREAIAENVNRVGLEAVRRW